MYLTASDEKKCTTVNKERNSSKLTTQVILVLYQKEKENYIKLIPKSAFDFSLLISEATSIFNIHYGNTF